MASSLTVTRMCPECLTTDAAFPLVEGCKSCKDTLQYDEYMFWNTPLYWVEEPLGNGKYSRKGVYAEDVLHHVVQPWQAFCKMIFLS